MLKKLFGKKKANNNYENNSDLLETIDRDKMPRHVAIIMDGNGRWAKEKGMLRSAGHTAGIKAL